MAALTKEQLKALTKRPKRTAEVAIGDDVVLLREWSNAEYEQFEMQVQKRKVGSSINMEGLRAIVIAKSVVDADGEKVFGENDLELRDLPASLAKRLFDESCKLNGLFASDVEDLAKN